MNNRREQVKANAKFGMAALAMTLLLVVVFFLHRLRIHKKLQMKVKRKERIMKKLHMHPGLMKAIPGLLKVMN